MSLYTDNLTAVLYKAKDIRLEQRPIPEPKDNEVLIQIECVGICGSDVHYWQHGQIGKYIVQKPMILGHEPSGTVVKKGKSVTNLKVGDRVAIEPGTPCRMCSYCKGGRYNLCPDVIYLATPPDDGCITRYHAHAADLCYKLPPNVSFEEGAFVQPLAIGIHTCERAGIRLGSTVLITGSGPIGLVSLLAAKAMGASKIICTDLLEHRLEVAKQCGADYTILVKPEDKEDELLQKMVDLLGDLPTNVMDCTGVQATIRLCMKATRLGGIMAIVGMGSDEIMVPMCRTAAKEIDIRGVFRFVNNYPDVLAMIESGKINVKHLITHRFTLEETLEAYDTAKTGKGNPVKILIFCNKTYSDLNKQWKGHV